MNSTSSLAHFVAELDARNTPSAVVDVMQGHVFDSITAAIAGGRVNETLHVAAIVAEQYGAGNALAIGTGLRTSLPAAALLGCVTARCSEVDDIHLRSCITPGAIIVPAAFALASTRPDIDAATLVFACTAGYETLIRFGLAIDGPQTLYRGIWPTYACAGFGIVATLGRLLCLPAAQIADAFGIAATLALGTTGRPAGPTSRWLTLGCAVQSGVLAVLAAQRGLRGDTALLDGPWAAITGIALDPKQLTTDLGAVFRSAELSYKPWCAAKQTIAATHAFRALLAADAIDANGIREIVVEVPSAYAAMIDKPHLPAGRQESFSSVHYQLALAAFAPELAYDVVRNETIGTAAVQRLMSVTRVVTDETFGVAYPAAWPARVRVIDASGSAHTREVHHPPGDPGTAFEWLELERKSSRVTGLADGTVTDLAQRCRSLPAGRLQGLLAAIERATQAHG
jgi:2-methylcitrate dehydratase PrpD